MRLALSVFAGLTKCASSRRLISLLHLRDSALHAWPPFRGTRTAEDKDGKHDEVKRAPAAITSLSAASRCASRPPSDPSVQSPRNGTRSEMTGFSRFYRPAFFINQ